jgi:adenylate cyclase
MSSSSKTSAEPTDKTPQLRAESLRLWQRFHFRLTLLYGGVVLLLLAMMGVIFYVRALDAERRGLQGRLRAAAVSLASGIDPKSVEVAAAGGEEAETVHQVLVARFRDVAAAEPEIASIYLLRPTDREGWLAFVADHVAHGNVPPAHVGRLYDATRAQHELDAFKGPMVEEEPYTDEWGTVLSGYAPVRAEDGTAVAIVGVDVFASRLSEMRRAVLITTVVLFGVAAFLVSALSWLVARNVRRPLSRIIQATASVAEGNFTVRASMDRRDEFGILGHQFDAMAEGLSERAFIKETFGAYVSPEVVRKVLERRQSAVAGERRRVTVLFADLRQFTSLSERMKPEEVVEILNAYLDRMTRVIADRGGRIDKFIGDAIMADWGALDEISSPEADAVRAALGMVAALADFNAQRGLAERPLAIGIGLHAGEAIAGSIGSAQKLEFTVIGDTVNVASRLEGLTKRYGAAIVASREIVAVAEGACVARRLDRAIVHGREEVTELYEVLDLSDPRAARVDLWERAMDLYVDARFEEAAQAFEEAARDLDDPAAAVQIDRCRELVRNPPATGWTGIARLTK